MRGLGLQPIHTEQLTAPARFCELLRGYRRATGQSQLQASLAAGISQRHLSFLESDRALPSRGLVLALGGTLGLSLAQQNELLLAAGYAPLFRPDDKRSDDVKLIEQAMDAFLALHEPYPALLLRDGVWIKKGNRGAAKLWSAVRGAPVDIVPEDNVFNLMLRRGPGREKLRNWSEAAACLLRRYMAEQSLVRHRELSNAATLLADHPEVRKLLQADPDQTASPVLLLNYRFDDANIRLFIVIASLQAPLDTRLEDLRVELFIPADDETKAWFQQQT